MPISNKIEVLPLVARLDDQIAELQASLAIIKQQKILLDQAIIDHRALLTPFRHLPDNIIGEIFLWCLPENQNALMSAREPPLLLGRVCSRWRSLAYNSPRLWTTLQVFLPVPPPRYSWNSEKSWVPLQTRQKLVADFDRLYANLCDAVQDWLNRSRHLPLSISIDFETCFSDSLLNHKLTGAYLGILISSSHRWRSLELYIPPELYHTFLTSIQPNSLTSLEFLKVNFEYIERDKVPTYLAYWNRCGLLSSKNLRGLHLSRNSFRLSDLAIAWTQITHLILGGVRVPLSSRGTMDVVTQQHAYAILRDCKHLQHCSLEICDSEPIFHPSDTLFLPSLTSLELRDRAYSIESLLQRIQVPALRQVTYYTLFFPSSTRRSPLLSLLRQSNLNVQSLTTSLDFFTVNDLVECFSLVPHLKHLQNWRSWSTLPRLRRWRDAEKPYQKKMMKAILDLFLPNSFNASNIAYPCPHLQTLTLTQSFGLTDIDALAFLQQRLKASVSEPAEVRRLDEVNINFENPMSVDIHSHLQSYIDQGMKVNFVYPLPSSIQKSDKTGCFNPVDGLKVGRKI